MEPSGTCGCQNLIVVHIRTSHSGHSIWKMQFLENCPYNFHFIQINSTWIYFRAKGYYSRRVAKLKWGYLVHQHTLKTSMMIERDGLTKAQNSQLTSIILHINSFSRNCFQHTADCYQLYFSFSAAIKPHVMKPNTSSKLTGSSMKAFIFILVTPSGNIWVHSSQL